MKVSSPVELCCLAFLLVTCESHTSWQHYFEQPKMETTQMLTVKKMDELYNIFIHKTNKLAAVV